MVEVWPCGRLFATEFMYGTNSCLWQYAESGFKDEAACWQRVRTASVLVPFVKSMANARLTFIDTEDVGAFVPKVLPSVNFRTKTFAYHVVPGVCFW
jgi:hypothetical protein